MQVRAVRVLAAAALVAALAPPPARAAELDGWWRWPAVGPILRGFDVPGSVYGPGHRGLDVAVPAGTSIVAPTVGVVSGTGTVGGNRYVTLDLGGGVVLTVSFLAAVSVRRGEVLSAGDRVGTSGAGHASATVPSFHLSIRIGDLYVDPVPFLVPLDVRGFIRLA